MTSLKLVLRSLKGRCLGDHFFVAGRKRLVVQPVGLMLDFAVYLYLRL